MKKILELHPFTLLMAIVYAWALLNFHVGTYVGIVCIIIYFVGQLYLVGEKERLFPVTTLVIILLVQLYALYARLYLLLFPGEIIANGMEGGLGAALLLISLIVVAPFFSIPPTLLLSRVNKKYSFLILPTVLLAGYWYYLYRFGTHF